MTADDMRRRARTWLWALACLACSVTVGLSGPTPAWAGKTTCLTGTDPVVVFDAGQVAYARDHIQYFACDCSSFDGSLGKTRADYLQCVKEQVDLLVSYGWLRKQCKGTVKTYFSKSTAASRRAVTWCRV